MLMFPSVSPLGLVVNGISALSNKKGGSISFPSVLPSFEESGLPESYRQAYDSIAYNNNNYTLSWADKIGNWLGFRTGEDKYREDMNLAAKEQYNQLLNQAREEQYNSPISQSERLRQAGINPDISGSVSSGEASEGTEPQTSPQSPSSDNIQQGLSFISGLVNVLGSCIAFSKDLTSLKGLKIANDIQDSNYVSSLFDSSLNTLLSIASPDDFISSNSLNVPIYRIGDYFFHSKKVARNFNSALNNGFDSIKGVFEKYSKLSDIERRKFDFAKSYGFSSRFDSDKEFSDVLGILTQKAFDVDNLNFDFEKRKANFGISEIDSAEYYDLPNNRAATEYAGLKNQHAEFNYQFELQSIKRSLVSQLKQKADSGNFMASVALLLISSKSFDSFNGLSSVSSIASKILK